jgi:hypothetical protein
MSELYKIMMGKYDEDVSNFLKTREEAVKDIRVYQIAWV